MTMIHYATSLNLSLEEYQKLEKLARIHRQEPHRFIEDLIRAELRRWKD